MAKIVFKNYSQGEISLFPANLEDKISPNAPVRLVNQIVDQLDITETISSYKGGGSSSYHPRMMLKLVLFAYLNNLYSCRKIEKETTENIHYMWLCGMQEPDHNTINRFRSFHLKDSINHLFTQVVIMLVEMGYLSKARIAQINREKLSKEDQKSVKMLEQKHLPKLQEYEKHLDTLGNRNSYSKTDKTATFMRLKDDHMKNGQLKPAYNVQIATENQFLTNFEFFPNPSDFLTLIPFNKGFKERYNKMPKKQVADSGYGSEENYEFMDNNNIEAFVKYPLFHAEQKKKYKNNAFLVPNLYYNAEKDYFVCPMGQNMENVGSSTRKSESGFVSNTTLYQAKNCTGCPLKCLCHKAKENRQIEINHKLNQYRQKARELLTCEEGLFHRSRRPIEPEAVFGQTKANKHYSRFRHFGLDKVKIDFAIFAMAFNIGKLYNKTKNKNKKQKKSLSDEKKTPIFMLTLILITEKMLTRKFYSKSRCLAA